MEQKHGRKPRVLSTSPLPDSSSGAFWVKFHKTLRCNSVSQTEPPTVDTPLTSATLQRDTSPAHSFLPSERKAKFSQKDFPRRDTFLKWGQPGLPRYFLGGELALKAARISPQAVLGKPFYPGLLTRHMNRFNRKSQKAARLCFPLRPFPHTQNRGSTWNLISECLATSPSYHLQMGNACAFNSIQPAQSKDQAGAQQRETLLKKWRAST